jgi:hypothetical protein
VTSELDDANGAMDALTDRCNVLLELVTIVGPPSSGVDLTAVEALATRVRKQADAIDEVVALAKAAMGET